MYFVYILKSTKTKELYKGLTNNLERRIKEHNKDRAAGTRGKGFWKLVYYEKFNTLEKARIRERYFKSGIGREKLKNLIPL